MIDNLLASLEGVRKQSEGEYIAKCPAHDDKHPSLSVSVKPHDIILIHCFAGCEPIEVVNAIGLTLADLYPKHSWHRTHNPLKRRAFTPLTVLRAVKLSALVVWVAAQDVKAGKVLSEDALAQLTTAVDLIWEAAHV